VSTPEARVAATIDHALLRPELTPDQVEEGCELAARYHVATVCCRPMDVQRCAKVLSGTGVGTITVIGFPHGAHHTLVKVAEAEQALADGAVELDMVLPIGLVRAGDDDGVHADIAAVVRAAAGAPVKVILETGFLTTDQIVRACHTAEAAGAAFVKTSTGYGPRNATVEDVRLMRATVSPSIGVKAAGGIRDLADALALLDAGATRLGTSSTATILGGGKATGY
jgi:deoxyribose-phosphate aldolase